ncbi:MAG TPA: ABC transporter permease subunit [Alphaproteobacteria bacterium]|nr:ABC transporter permease subunit [Alphaproteobacteria bacterium]
MKTATLAPTAEGGRFSPRLLAWIGVLAFTFALAFYAKPYLPWAAQYPTRWIIPLKHWVNSFMNWLIRDLDFGLFTFQELTRSIAWLLDWPLLAAQALLAGGVFIRLEGDPWLEIPRLSWLGIVLAVALLGWRFGGASLAAVAGGAFFYLALFNQWDSAMMTLASIVIAVPFGVAGGLALGILAYRRRWAELAIQPMLDLMQTVPVFAYLVPVLFLFGFGPVAAMIATIVFAMPPMVRVTILALRRVPPETVEFGRMAGCSKRQMLWRVLLPSARPGLMLGVNQVIMMSLNMVIIASMIGAGGLGFDVLAALRRLDIGAGLEAGLAIVVMAVALDRLSQAFAADRPPPDAERRRRSFVHREPVLTLAGAVLLVTTLLSFLLPALAGVPEDLTVTTRPIWAKLVQWINVNFFDELEAVKTFVLLNLLVPVKRFMLGLPWPGVILLLGLAGWQLGGWKLALLAMLLSAFIAATGNWPNAMETIYLVGISAMIAALIGIPLGMWGAASRRVHQVLEVIVDTLQTLPSFVYLMPVVMLFRVGDFAAMLAVIAYAVAPAIRYTDHGMRAVPAHLIEAARAAGCTRRQILWRVKLPLSVPEIMLGMNQTVMLAISMLVITALVGTRDLGQEVYVALTKADTGRGIVAGLCVAFIAIIADRLIGASSARARARLGLA